MSSSTTRISDLPDNISSQMPTSAFPMNVAPPTYNVGEQPKPPSGGQMPNTYAPINIHPNPYGNAPQSNNVNTIPQPQYTKQSTNQNMSNDNIKYSLDSGGPDDYQQHHQRLPSRDIPHNTLGYTHDEEIQPNYIPPPSTQNDYIKEYEQRKEPALKTHEKQKKRVQFADDWLTKFQTPILVIFMYFVFQLAVINKALYRILGKTPLYGGEGNMNWMGVLFKSALFGTFYMSITSTIDYISYM
jgi:hypothetical protein